MQKKEGVEMDRQTVQADYFWKKKEVVSFVLSILVFWIHISAFSPYLAGDDAVAVFNGKLSFFFKESVTRFAVPMYFILSGMVFFRDYSNKKYLSKIRSRFFTLVIPYLIWNTLCMLFDIVCSYTFISSFLSGRELFELSAANVLNGILLHGSNIPFWYILYLIVLVLLSPLLDLLVRNKYVGMISVTVLTALTLFRFGPQYGFHDEAIVFYLLGALLGKHYFGFFTQKTGKISGIVSAAFLFVYILLKNLFPTNEYFALPAVRIIVFALAAYALWCVMDLFTAGLSPRPIYGRSFPIFAMHTNISAIIYKICYLILPKNGYMALPNFLATTILTILAINVFCIVFERFLPSAYALFMGKGIKKSQNKRKETKTNV